MKKILSLLLLIVYSLPFNVMAGLDIALPEMGDSAGAYISPEEEYQIGQAYFWNLQQSVDLIEDPEINSYIESLGYRLVGNSDSPHLRFTFFMVPDASVNAFATPGGFIGTHSGLVLTSQSEDELASVLSHEIAHITQRHLLRSYERSQNMDIPMTVAMIAAALLGVADPQAGLAAVMAVQAGGTQGQIDFIRANEKEADNIGMLTLVRSGFDAQAMPTFFERLQYEGRFYTGNAVPEFLRTHPVTTNRIAEARGRAVSYPLLPQNRDTLLFYLMRERLRVMMAEDVHDLVREYEEVIISGRSLNITASQYGYSLALAATGKHIHAKKVLQGLIEQDKDRLTYQLALAKVEVSLGDLSTALKIYKTNQELYPDDQALTLNQVKALLKAHLPKEADKLLNRQIELGLRSPQLYKLLSQATADMGERSQSHQWLAEYYYVSGHLTLAADQLHSAMKSAGHNEYQLAKISARLNQIETIIARIEALRNG